VHVGYGAALQQVNVYPDAQFVREELELCVLAESLGLDSVWLPEHHFSDYSVMPDPLQALAYLAGRTKTIKLGVGVIVLPWHDPLRVAEKVILLDHISNGRLIVGFGRGLARAEFLGLRVNQDEARPRFNEHAELVLKALETGFMEGGALTNQPLRELRPRPFKSFRGRAFSAAMSPESAPLMAKLGLGLLVVNLKPKEVFQSEWLAYSDCWRLAHGSLSEPPKPLLSGLVVVDESADRAEELAMKYVKVSQRISIQHYGLMEPEFGTAKGYEHYLKTMKIDPDTDIDKLAETYAKGMPHGTPNQVLEYYATLKETLDMQGIFAHFKFGGMPREEAERNLRCFAKHCLPELKSWSSVCSLEEAVEGPKCAA
jgi:alkanesulfonate monooxygenase SsuD/methylene tetrahydromethanopterin reductase-like flavin-dependent oxidoreductase (luciferase family)